MLLKHHQESQRPCMVFTKFTHTLLKYHQASQRSSITLTKFTHTLLKHRQANQRPDMECVERENGELGDHLFENFVFFLEKTLVL